MAFEIVAGRTPKQLEKYGLTGTIFLGKNYVSFDGSVSLANPIYLDVAGPHVILVSGKRGSGKSYTLSVIAEGLVDLPPDISANIAGLIFDTMGIFWTMKYPNYRDDALLREWGLQPKSYSPLIYVPFGLFEDYQAKGVPVDFPFALKPSEIAADSWCEIFGLDFISGPGTLVERALEAARQKHGEDFDLDEIIACIREDSRSSNEEKNIVENRFQAAKKWGLFRKEGTPITELFRGGTTTIIDLSAYAQVEGGDRIKALVIGLVCKKILEQRMAARKAEEISLISEGGFIFGEEAAITEEKAPLVWIFIDECLPGDSEIITSKAHTKIKDLVERFEKGERFKVLGYDPKTKSYNYYDVTGVYRKAKRNVLKILTETGRELKCTPDHRILTKLGWLNAVNASEVAIPILSPYSEHPEHIKARLAGYLLGKTMGSKSKVDLEKVAQDLSKLGFNFKSVVDQETHNKLCALVGSIKKTLTVPEWLIHSSDKTKAEFLSAFFGSVAQIISPKNTIKISFNEANSYFAKQLVQLLQDVNVKAKISKTKRKLTLTIDKNSENIIKFLEKVGYKYCQEKELAAAKRLAYLKARTFAEKFSKKKFPDIETWFAQRYDGNVLFERIVKIEMAGQEELYDISVAKVHNFVANGCIVHNCHEFLPREPERTLASGPLIQLLREGRQPGISLVLATQQPGKIHTDVMTQADIVISHRLTAKIDIEALNLIAATYLPYAIQKYIDELPPDKGTAIILDDKLERIYPMRVRPKMSWHGGEDPTAIRSELKSYGLTI